MLIYIVFILSIIFVVGFVGLSSKPSPIYGGVSLVISGGVGCGVIVSYGGSFLGLIVFLIYLGGMLVVFGYTTAIAIEQYPEIWTSNLVVFGSFVVGLIVEMLLVVYILIIEELGLVYEFNGIGDWVNYWFDKLGVLNSEIIGVGALYSYGIWLVLITGWSLLIGVVVVLEVTRGV